MVKITIEKEGTVTAVYDCECAIAVVWPMDLPEPVVCLRADGRGQMAVMVAAFLKGINAIDPAIFHQGVHLLESGVLKGVPVPMSAKDRGLN